MSPVRQRAVARAHRWFDEISTGKARSLAEFAAREGLAVRYVGRLIRLAFLASDIVESIVEGRQPTSLTVEAVTRHIEIRISSEHLPDRAVVEKVGRCLVAPGSEYPTLTFAHPS